MADYCHSRFQAKRNITRAVNVGQIGIGGNNPIRIQSMTNTPTQDVQATLRQCIALAEVGCEIVRITAQNVEAAKALKHIRKQFSQAGFAHIPLVADIHFLPKAAMEAIEHVEKVRINPGNYADKKKFDIIEYSDTQYQEELDRLYQAFTPLILRAKTLGRTLRIGTNHGSLSDRIMNRFGDTPLGMVESALEFIRIAESHNFHDIVVSLKASNPKVMIQAYRLCAQKMQEQNISYPLHLGVTEAGNGEDGRIKSAIGIGTLLADGIGDTIRVSLTEDPVYEIPVAKDLAQIAHKLWDQNSSAITIDQPQPNFVDLGKKPTVPAVFIKPHLPISQYHDIAKEVIQTNNASVESKIEGLVLEISNKEDLHQLLELQKILISPAPSLVLDLEPSFNLSLLEDISFSPQNTWILCKKFTSTEDLLSFLNFTKQNNLSLAINCHPHEIPPLKSILEKHQPNNLILTTTSPATNHHAIGTYRAIAELFSKINIPTPPIWIRNTPENAIDLQNNFTSKILESSILSGSLFCDGLGDFISIESEPIVNNATALAYNILQGARLRLTKTEFVACPSCGRTLFDLETTTNAIREKTGHLKGVTIAVMGCIVNGPGEMADADFGYVGGAPEKINLYVGKNCVQYNIPQEYAVEKLIELIKKQNKWVEPHQIA